MFNNNLLRTLITVLALSFFVTVAYATEDDDGGTGGGDSFPPITCNTCTSAYDAAEAAQAAGLPVGQETNVYNYATQTVWRVVRSVSLVGEYYVQQIAGPGVGTILTGMPSLGVGEYDEQDGSIDTGDGMTWNCVTPWSMYCF